MKQRLFAALAVLMLAGTTSISLAQDRTFAARSFLMDDNAGHSYRLQVPLLTGNVMFTFPSTPILPGSLLYGSADNTLSILPGGSPGDILVYSGTSMPAWSSTLSSLHLNSLDLGTNGPGGIPGSLNIRDGANPGSYGTLGFNGTYFMTGGAGVYTSGGAIDAYDGSISGGSLNVGSGPISGGSLSVGTGAISGGSLNVGSGAITGGAISGTTLTLGGTITGATGLNSSGDIVFSALGSGVVHSSSGTLGVTPVYNSELYYSSVTLSNGTGVTVTGGTPLALGGSATIAIGQDVATTATPSFAGMTLNGGLDMTTHKIINVLDPTAAQDVATKSYVDLNSAGVLIHPSTTLRNTIDPTADVVLLTLKAFAGQTQHLMDATNSVGTVLAYIDAAGGFSATSVNAGSGMIQTTGTVQAAQVAVTTSLSGAGASKFAGLLPAVSVSEVNVTVPELLPTSSITVTLETTVGGLSIPFVSLRTPGAPGTFRVSFTGVTPADGQINYVVIK